jgi:hypothetical protein
VSRRSRREPPVLQTSPDRTHSSGLQLRSRLVACGDGVVEHPLESPPCGTAQQPARPLQHGEEELQKPPGRGERNGPSRVGHHLREWTRSRRAPLRSLPGQGANSAPREAPRSGRPVQTLLEHRDLKTTMAHTRVPDRGPIGVQSPLDRP